MGIDVYLNWRGMTMADKEKQHTGFSTTSGQVGYLRESYHGGPYATRILMPEGFLIADTECQEHEENHDGCYEDHEDQYNQMVEKDGKWGIHSDGSECNCNSLGAIIPAETMRGRLEEVCGTVINRAKDVYGETKQPDDPEVQAFVEFVKLAEAKEREGLTVFVYVSY